MKLYHGDEGYNARLSKNLDNAAYSAKRIADDPDFELTVEPESINVCFEYRDVPSAEICDLLDQKTELMIGHGQVKDTSCIRLVCVNPDLEHSDIDRILKLIKSAACEIQGNS